LIVTSFPAQQDVQPSIAEPAALVRQLSQTRPQVAIIRPPLTHPNVV
jgi:hypothetical protein